MKQYLSYVLTCLSMSFFIGPVSAQDDLLPAGEIFGSMSARQIGPGLMSGRISDMEGHPTNSKIIYAGTAGGGVWKSTNGGATFSSIFDDYCQSIGVVRLDPHDPDNTIYVGTGEVWTRNSTSIGDGLFKSTDGGGSWTKLPYENSERISSVIIHPEDKNTIYVGELGALWGDSDDRGVYKSTDGGQTWQSKNIGNFVNKIRIMTTPDEEVIAYAIGQRIYKMTDALPTSTQELSSQNNCPC